jgi:hypothetical protein
MKLAPIVLFVYSRLWHTQQTVEALKKNELASESELFIYSDAPKNEEAKEKVKEVREYIKTINGFKRVTIIERENNWVLANSIIDGVTKIVNEYGKIIVLEDDLVTSPYFLKFMNEALEFYKDEKKVWHISGWNYPIECDKSADTFLWRVMNCWGWATWDDRWKYYEKDVNKLINHFSREDIKRFNLKGAENFWGQVIANKKGKINTWAIFWYGTIFQNQGLCLNPKCSFVRNIGLDGSGIHCGNNTLLVNMQQLNINQNIDFVKIFQEDKQVVKQIKQYYKKSKKTFLIRVINKLSRMIIKRNIVK